MEASLKRSVILALVLTFVALAGDATTKLVLGPAPDGWKPRIDERQRFLYDFTLPDEARVNVMRFDLGFEDYRAKLLGSWKKADGSPLALGDQKVEQLEGAAIKVRTIELAGTYAHKDEPAKPDFALVAAHLRGPGGHWTAWLIGPAKSVAKHRAAYLEWVKTAKVEEVAESDAVREVRFVHGAPAHGVPGPWSLTGYRIGKSALAKLGITREQSWDIVITHRSPKEVRYTCMMDGLLAATGASPGKMNLRHEAVESEDGLETVITHERSHRVLTYKLKKAFRDKIREIPYEGFPEAAKMLDSLKDDEVFEVTESSR